MDSEDVATILDSAKYLRTVRPIDPAELASYLPDSITQTDVNHVLREHAVDLQLVEHADGTYGPPPETAREIPFEPIVEIPEEIQRNLEAILVEEYGSDWWRDQTGDRLRRAIREFKQAYLERSDVTYDRDAVYGYSIYHLPASFAAIQYELAKLDQASLLPGRLRVLDVGAGVGGQALGLFDFVDRETLVEYHAIEPSEPATELLSTFLESSPSNVHCTITVSEIEGVTPEGPYDLILLCNVLNELSEPVKVLDALRKSLDPSGTLLVIEPADEQTSRGLRSIESLFLSRHPEVSVFTPTQRLWDGQQPADDCWSFTSYPDLAVPLVQRQLDEGRRRESTDREPATREFINVDVRYSPTHFRLDDQVRVPFYPAGERFRSLRNAESSVTERIDLAAMKLSSSLAETNDDNPLYVIGDGSQREEWFAVHINQTGLTTQLTDAAYGDLLLLSNALVLWNEDESAFNLVVDDEAVVERVDPTGRYGP